MRETHLSKTIKFTKVSILLKLAALVLLLTAVHKLQVVESTDRSFTFQSVTLGVLDYDETLAKVQAFLVNRTEDAKCIFSRG